MLSQKQLTLLLLKDAGLEDNLLHHYLTSHPDDTRFSVSEASFQEDLSSYKNPDMILINIQGREIDFSKIKSTRSFFEDSVIVILAESANASEIIESVKAGANEFLIRTPQTIKLLAQKLERAHQLADKKRRIPGARTTDHNSPYVGRTIEGIRYALPNIINSAINTVYIEGETGTGKEVVVDLFKEAVGPNIPFISVNCGAIAPSLMESEFFGHIKGSFTGANNNKIGFIEKASGGYLFLDEVANLTREAQAALLRTIENQEILPVGETKTRPISVRFISATNENLEKLVQAGKFRQDLWQRLSEKVINLPPLRNRRHEIPALIKSIANNMAGGPYQVSPSAVEVLSSASWQSGNIRQLRNCLRAATEFHVDKMIGIQSIPLNILKEVSSDHFDNVTPFPNHQESDEIKESAKDKNSLTLKWSDGATPSFDDLADQLLIKMIKNKTQGQDKISLRKLAASMGMVRNTLSNRMKVLSRKNMLREPEMLKLIGEY